MATKFGSFLVVFLICSLLGNISAGQYGTVIGIDLGTTYSCVGVYQFGRVEIIHNDQGNRITPSYIAFTKDGERLVGDGALNQLTRNPENTFFDAKRFIGRTFDDPVVQNDIRTFPFKVVNIDNKPYVEAYASSEKKRFSAEEISGMVLSKMKRTAEDYLGKKVTHAVITVPAYFHDAQRQATKDAAAIAGLEVLRIINEPTAAAISYGLDRIEQEKTILVYDLGGGTFDVTLFRIEEEKVKVLQTSGDLHLGGQDFDKKVVDYFVEVFKRKTGVDISNNKKKKQKLRLEVEKAKRAISTSYQTRIEIDSFVDGHDFSEVLTRAKFEDLNKDYFYSTLVPVEKVLTETNTRIEDVDEVLLVGGSTRIPKIQEIISNYFNGKQLSKGIHPDEAVAHGATIQAAILNGDFGISEKLIVDVLPHSLGIETGLNSKFTRCIAANTPIPVNVTEHFTTIFDHQKHVMFPIYEGENQKANENTLIGKFSLDNIQIAEAGIPKFIVNLSINEDGILTVTAMDEVTGSRAEITVKYNEHRITHEELDKLITNEQKMIEMDKKFEYLRKHSEL